MILILGKKRKNMLTIISAHCTLERRILFLKNFMEVGLMHICFKIGYSTEGKEQQEFLKFLKILFVIMEKIQNILLRLNTKGEWMQEDLDLLLLEKNGHHDLILSLIFKFLFIFISIFIDNNSNL